MEKNGLHVKTSEGTLFLYDSNKFSRSWTLCENIAEEMHVKAVFYVICNLQFLNCVGSGGFCLCLKIRYGRHVNNPIDLEFTYLQLYSKLVCPHGYVREEYYPMNREIWYHYYKFQYRIFCDCKNFLVTGSKFQLHDRLNW